MVKGLLCKYSLGERVREELSGEMAFGQRPERSERTEPPDSANKNIGWPVQAELQVNKPMHYLGH